MKSFSNMQRVAIMRFGICLNMILHKLWEYLFMVVCLIIQLAVTETIFMPTPCQGMKEGSPDRLLFSLLKKFKSTAGCCSRHPKKNEVRGSPVKAFASGYLRLHIWPSAPQAQKLSLLGSILDLIRPKTVIQINTLNKMIFKTRTARYEAAIAWITVRENWSLSQYALVKATLWSKVA